MPLRVKLDEDLPLDVALVLRNAGIDTHTVREEGLGGCSDDDVWRQVQSDKRCLITADKGFADIRRHSPGTHHGIILFRLERESRAGYARLTQELVDYDRFDELGTTITVVTSGAIRIYRQ